VGSGKRPFRAWSGGCCCVAFGFYISNIASGFPPSRQWFALQAQFIREPVQRVRPADEVGEPVRQPTQLAVDFGVAGACRLQVRDDGRHRLRAEVVLQGVEEVLLVDAGGFLVGGQGPDGVIQPLASRRSAIMAAAM